MHPSSILSLNKISFDTRVNRILYSIPDIVKAKLAFTEVVLGKSEVFQNGGGNRDKKYKFFLIECEIPENSKYILFPDECFDIMISDRLTPLRIIAEV